MRKLMIFLLGCITTSLSLAKEVSFKQDILPVLMNRCAICHLKEDRHGYLVIDEENAYAGLVNIPSYTLPSMKRIEPGQPDKSYFWLKITDQHLAVGGKGWEMPYMSSLSDAEIQQIHDWIMNGAPDN